MKTVAEIEGEPEKSTCLYCEQPLHKRHNFWCHAHNNMVTCIPPLQMLDGELAMATPKE